MITGLGRVESDICNIPIDCNPKLGEVKLIFTDEFKPKVQYVMELFHFRVILPELMREKEYKPDFRVLLTVKF